MSGVNVQAHEAGKSALTEVASQAVVDSSRSGIRQNSRVRPNPDGSNSCSAANPRYGLVLVAS